MLVLFPKLYLSVIVLQLLAQLNGPIIEVIIRQVDKKIRVVAITLVDPAMSVLAVVVVVVVVAVVVVVV